MTTIESLPAEFIRTDRGRKNQFFPRNLKVDLADSFDRLTPMELERPDNVRIALLKGVLARDTFQGYEVDEPYCGKADADWIRLATMDANERLGMVYSVDASKGVNLVFPIYTTKFHARWYPENHVSEPIYYTMAQGVSMLVKNFPKDADGRGGMKTGLVRILDSITGEEGLFLTSGVLRHKDDGLIAYIARRLELPLGEKGQRVMEFYRKTLKPIEI